MRLTTRRVRLLKTLPPLIRLSGHNPNQEQKRFSEANALRSAPTSASKVKPAVEQVPSIAVKSTPNLQYNPKRNFSSVSMLLSMLGRSVCHIGSTLLGSFSTPPA